jgi:hypothetical protein
MKTKMIYYSSWGFLIYSRPLAFIRGWPDGAEKEFSKRPWSKIKHWAFCISCFPSHLSRPSRAIKTKTRPTISP